MWAYIVLFFHLLYGGTMIQASNCVCTSVDCPVRGANPIIMGNGNAHLTYIYKEHKSHNVVVHVDGIITPESLDTGTETTDCTRKYSRMLEDDGEQSCDAGHILARRLGGYGNLPTNIFPQNATINEGIFAQFEGKIYDCMKNAVAGHLTWDFIYESNQHTMPYMVTYSAKFDEGLCNDLSSSFPN